MRNHWIGPRLPAEPPIIFLHLPKTAGSTLRQILRRQYGPRGIFEVDGYSVERSLATFAAWPSRRRRRVRAFLAQFPFGIHELIPGPTQYVTLLRHPVDRIVSHYSYVKRDSTSRLHAEVASRNLGLRDYVLDSRWATLINNGQTGSLGNDIFPRQRPATRELLDAAKANLEERFTVVGLTERFDESALLMKNAFGWGTPLYTKVKVSPRLPGEELDEATSETILEHNQLDLELYEFVRARFEILLGQQDAGFFRELETFRRANDLFASAGAPVKPGR